MKRARLASSVPPMKINVVPIIDVSLVLVVILLVTAPVLAVSDLPITLPEAATRGVEDELRVSITIGMHGEIAVDENDVSPALLRAAIAKRIAETRPDVLVAVRADAALPYAQVEAILKEARLAGARRIAIATRQGDHLLDGGRTAAELESGKAGDESPAAVPSGAQPTAVPVDHTPPATPADRSASPSGGGQ